LEKLGIAYDIEVIEDEEDSSGGIHRMEGLLDQWFAREACRFLDSSCREEKKLKEM